MLHAEGCILRMPGSSMDKCDCLNVQDEDPYLGIILNTKGTLSDFCEKLIDERLLGDLFLMRWSRPGMGRDKEVGVTKAEVVTSSILCRARLPQ